MMEPQLRDADGQWKFELQQFSLNISEPILAKIRQYAASSVFKAKYRSEGDEQQRRRATDDDPGGTRRRTRLSFSPCLLPLLCPLSRMQNGYVDLKDALKWQLSALIMSRVGGAAKFCVNSLAGCEFAFLLTYTTDVPEQEYSMIVSTLPRNEQAATKRPPGDFSIPASHNPSLRDSKPCGDGRFKKKGKKNPRQDAMGQKTVMEAMPKIKSEMWIKLDVFEPIRKNEAAAAAAAAAASAAAATAATPDAATTSTTPVAATPAVASAPSSEPSASASVAMDTSSSSSSSATAAVSVRAGLTVPAHYPLPLSCLVPFPALLFTVHREPVLVSGNYLKFYRFLSQSVWKLAGTKQLGGGAAAATASAAKTEEGAVASNSTAASSTDAATAAAASPGSDDEENEDDENGGGGGGAAGGDDEDGDDDEDDGMRRMTDSSVEEEIVRMVLKHFDAKEYKFHSSGREDMDVRMLGNGRTFFLEFIEARRVPRAQDFYDQLQKDINANSEFVQVLNLHLSSKAEFNQMKKDVSTKRKKYRCVVWVDQALSGPNDPRLAKLDAIKDLVLQQRTPIRVLHR